eukprot:657064-Rhodomonas_salina.1
MHRFLLAVKPVLGISSSSASTQASSHGRVVLLLLLVPPLGYPGTRVPGTRGTQRVRPRLHVDFFGHPSPGGRPSLVLITSIKYPPLLFQPVLEQT